MAQMMARVGKPMLGNYGQNQRNSELITGEMFNQLVSEVGDMKRKLKIQSILSRTTLEELEEVKDELEKLKTRYE